MSNQLHWLRAYIQNVFRMCEGYVQSLTVTEQKVSLYDIPKGIQVSQILFHYEIFGSNGENKIFWDVHIYLYSVI